jgi:PAS domain S-box-containing protein
MPSVATSAPLDALPCGFVELDPDDRVVHWNRRLERWTGLPLAQVAGRPLPEVFPGNPAIAPLLAEIRASRRPRVLAQVFHHRLIPVPLPAGHLSGLAEMQQECHVVPLDSPAGHVAITILDVTPLVVGQQRSQQLLIERNRAEASMRRRADFLAALNQTTFEMMARRNVTDLLQALAERCTTLLNSPHAEIALLEGDALVVRASSSGCEYLRGDFVPRAEPSIAWQAVASQVPVVVASYAEHPNRRALYQPYKLQAATAIPILRGQECLGVLGLARTLPNQPFTEEDMQQAGLLAHMVALVLHNATIHEEAVREAETRTKALRESEQRFRAVFDQSPIMIALLALPDNRFVELNAAALATFGYTREEAIGRTPADLNLWVDEGLRSQYLQRLAADGAVTGFESELRRKDGSILTVLQSGCIVSLAGRPYNIASLQDITERRKAEEQLRHMQKLESIGILAGGIAHDFNNILTGTFGFVELARLELPDDHPVQAWLDRIATSSQRARELVRQILTFSRKQEGKRSLQRLHDAVNETLGLLRSTLPPNIVLETQVSATAPAAMADATQIHQVVLNLCTNAWQAMPLRGGRIAVTLEAAEVGPAQAATHFDLRPGPYVRLTVSDNGCGMDPATLEHIFEPFFTRKETGSGSGLGLAVVHGIVKLHQGAITVRSTPGLGSTFELYFPAVAGEPVPTVPMPSEIPRGSGQRILLVDDDAISGFAIEKMIETLNYAVHRCSRPEDALAAFAAAPDSWDLVVSDLAMPGMNGDELVGHILRLRPQQPAIIVTGYVETVRQQIIEQTPVRAVLHKPIVRQELAQALAAHVRRTA